MQAAQRGMATKTEPHEALRLGNLSGCLWSQGNDPEIDDDCEGKAACSQHRHLVDARWRPKMMGEWKKAGGSGVAET